MDTLIIIILIIAGGNIIYLAFGAIRIKRFQKNIKVGDYGVIYHQGYEIKVYVKARKFHTLTLKALNKGDYFTRHTKHIFPC